MSFKQIGICSNCGGTVLENTSTNNTYCAKCGATPKKLPNLPVIEMQEEKFKKLLHS